MSVTARDICQSALEELKVYGIGETASDADIARSFSELNMMLDLWSNDSLACFANLEQSGALVPGKSTYTIGTSGGADFPVTRPIRIKTGPGAAYMLDPNGNSYQVEVIEKPEYNQLINNNVNSNIVMVIWYDSQFPLGILNCFPQPNIAWTLYWDSFLQLTTFTSLSAAMSFPPGYETALKKNLAIQMKAFYPKATLEPTTIRQAAKSLGSIKRSNVRANVASFDPEILARAQGFPNIYAGRSN